MNGWSLNDFLSSHLDDLIWILAIGILALGAALVVRRSVQQRFGANSRALMVLRQAHAALLSVIVMTAIRLMLIRISVGNAEWDDLLTHLASVAFTASCVWFACEIIIAIEDLLILQFVERQDVSDVRVRKFNTQVRLVSHLAVVGVILIGLGFMLLSIPQVRIVGTSLLASAGIVSVVAGMAARTALSNLFAGLQLALSDAVRVGDAIQVGPDAGLVDEISLTYVIVALWDERRLIIPSGNFVANEFQNWTRKGNEISAVVTASLAWTVPVEDVVAAVKQAVLEAGVWDQRFFDSSISNVANGVLTLQIVVSTANVKHMFKAQAVVNQAIVHYVTSQTPVVDTGT